MKIFITFALLAVTFVSVASADPSPVQGYRCAMLSSGVPQRTIDVQFVIYPDTLDLSKGEIQVTLRHTRSNGGVDTVLEELKNFSLKAVEPYPGGTKVVLEISEKVPFSFLGRLGNLLTGSIEPNVPVESFELMLNPANPGDLDTDFNGVCRYDSGLKS